MKIFKATQIRAADQFTIQNKPISSIDLMETAARVSSEWLGKKFDSRHYFIVFCGVGNNGGDGLAIARMLHHKGYNLECYVLYFSKKTSPDFESNKKRLVELAIPFQEISTPFECQEVLQRLNKKCMRGAYPIVFIDAILGSGLNRAVDGQLAELIQGMNCLQKITVAIDIPSGLFSEGQQCAYAIQANYTLSFELPKLAFFLPQNDSFVGEWQLLPIGISAEFIAKEKTSYYYLQKEDIQPLVKKRAKFSHKGSYGHCWVVAGMLGKMGAAILCAKAALRAGAGLVSLYIPQCGYTIAQSALPEVMVELGEENNFLCGKWQEKDGVVALGCGLGLAEKTQDFVYSVLTNTTNPMVIDADALNILAKDPSWFLKIPQGSILTPHPKEFQRLVGPYDNDLQKIAKQKEFAKKYQVYLILKGAHSAIATPDGEVFFNSTGNAAMAKGGSGDMLTGMLAALLAQGYSSLNSCLLGVYLHGLCGDICVQKYATEAIIASDLIAGISDAWNFIK